MSATEPRDCGTIRPANGRAQHSVERRLAILRYGLRSALRGSAWLWALPLTIAAVVTLAQILWKGELSPTLQVTTGEVMGSLLAGLLGANLLDAEFRLHAGEIIFTKPYPPWRIIAGRVGAALAAVLCLVSINTWSLTAIRGLHQGWLAVAAAACPSFFLCALACALHVGSKSVMLAYVGPALFWIWSTLGEPVGIRFDRMYNPLFQISAWSGYLQSPSRLTLETLVVGNIVMVGAGVLLLAWCCARARSACLQ